MELPPIDPGSFTDSGQPPAIIIAASEPDARSLQARVRAASDALNLSTKPADGARALVPGDAPRTIANAWQQAREALRDLFGRAAAAGQALDAQSTLPTDGPIDLQRYAGLWYELARLPTRFQDSRSVSTAEYSIRPDGVVTVRNTAYLGDRTDARITGTATVAAGADNDRLRVRFGGLLSLIPVPKDGNYWIIDVADDYSTALVGTPDRTFLWLLSRDKDAWGTTPIDALVDRATELGFDTDRLLVADWKTRLVRTG